MAVVSCLPVAFFLKDTGFESITSGARNFFYGGQAGIHFIIAFLNLSATIRAYGLDGYGVGGDGPNAISFEVRRLRWNKPKGNDLIDIVEG